MTRIAVLGARRAPRDTGNQPRALRGYQGQSPWLVQHLGFEPRPSPSVEPTVPPIRPPAPPAPAPPPGPPDFSAIDRALEALPLGSIGFNASPVMTLNRSDNIRLLVSPSLSVEELQQQLRDRLPRETQVEGNQIRIAPYMEARLSGTNFSILALTPELQPVTWKEPTEWRWDVRPPQVSRT